MRVHSVLTDESDVKADEIRRGGGAAISRYIYWNVSLVTQSFTSK
jgi:hypothetical protein